MRTIETDDRVRLNQCLAERDEALETIAKKDAVIAKLKEQRNLYHTFADENGVIVTPIEMLDAEIAAALKGERL